MHTHTRERETYPGFLYGAGTAVVGVTPLRARPSGAADGRREVEIRQL